MGHISYNDSFGLEQACPYDEQVQQGDLVSLGINLFPQFTVLAVVDDKVWLRDVQSGTDGIAAVSRCRKIDG